MTLTTRLGTPIGPRHKAAIAVLALDEEVAGQILAQLDDRELKALSAAVDELDVVPGEALIGVLEELEKALGGPVSVARTGGAAYVRRLAATSLGEDRANKLFAPPVEPEIEPITQLRSARTQALADLLADEHPQIAAVVLTQLPARTAAKILQALPPELSAELTGRLAALEDIPDRAVLEASDSLVRALAATGGLSSSDQRSEFDGLAFAAALVNEFSTDEGDALLARVGERDAAIAAKVREAMFTFDDLLRIEQRALGPLLRAVQGETMIIALQTASESLREHFFGALSQRAAQTMREDLSATPPRRVAEVEAAQREIVESAMRLAAEGTLQLPPRGGES
jgi:flagellar motor switch protein FliG